MATEIKHDTEIEGRREYQEIQGIKYKTNSNQEQPKFETEIWEYE